MTPLFRYRVGSYDSIIKPGNTVPLIEFSLRSLDECLARGPGTGALVGDCHRLGRERLLLRLAYSHLTNYQPALTREAIRTAWSEGGARSLRAASLYAASCLPGGALRLAHRLKRSLRPRKRAR